VNRTLTDWKELVKEISLDRRSGKRLRLNFLIEIVGFDPTGRLFTEQTKTLDISEFGCRFDLHTPVRSGNVLALRLLPPAKSTLPEGNPLLFEVIWSVSRRTGWTVGTRKLQDDKMWKVVTFPLANQSSKPAAK
jgi:hypothetical protein